jgi:hypothetical protein
MMERRWVLVLAVLCGTLGCGPTVQDLYMAKDSGGKVKTTSFRQHEEVHVHGIVHGGDRGSIMNVRIEGMAFEVDYYPWPNRDVVGKAEFDIQLIQVFPGEVGPDGLPGEPQESPNGPWKLGKFVAEVTLDGEELGLLPFEVIPSY